MQARPRQQILQVEESGSGNQLGVPELKEGERRGRCVVQDEAGALWAGVGGLGFILSTMGVH